MEFARIPHPRGPFRLAYQRLGDTGARVLLLVGLGVPGRRWRPIAEELARDHQVLFLDNRGVGESELPPGSCTMPDLARDVIALLDHLRWPLVHVVGMSMGGMIAQHLALLQPHRVLSLGLLATHAGGPATWLPDPRGVWHFLGVRLARHPNPHHRELARLLFPVESEDAKHTTRLGYLPSEAFGPPTRWPALVRHVGAYLGHDTRQQLPLLARVPTLVVQPGRDVLVAPRHVDGLSHLFPHATVLRLPNATHALLREAPTQLEAAIRDLIAVGEGISRSPAAPAPSRARVVG